ncbi:MAG: carboxymuconolactone decarboxylase family protein [Kofleriaceae bacterium]
MGLRIIGYTESSGDLREAYDRSRERPLPPVYIPRGHEVAGIIRAHSLDAQLIPKVGAVSTSLVAAGPLSWSERELVATVTSRLNQSYYCTACHSEFLRAAMNGDREMSLAAITTPRSVRAGTPRMQRLAELATIVTEAPWTMSPMHRERAHDVGLDDDDILHAIMLSSHVGHMDRVADAVGISLEYDVEIKPPLADQSSPALAAAPVPIIGRPVIDPTRRPAAVAAFAAWRSYMYERDAPLSRRQRTVIARWVALWLGDASISPPDDLTINPLDDALRELAHVVTLAPWTLSDATFAGLRAAGFDDAALFDACTVASSMTVFSRMTVALAALGRDKA